MNMWTHLSTYFVSERPSIIDSMDYAEQVDFILPRSEMIHAKSMSYLSFLGLNVNLDNVWLTTIAGKLFYNYSK